MKDAPGRTRFGGGINPPELWPKTSQFWSYNSIIDGYGLVKEYNEERAHAWMLTDHKNITRFKFDTCLQCKSTNATAALEQHRQAHVRWENLIVSENSMGFHNAAEVRQELEAAIVFAKKAQELAKQ